MEKGNKNGKIELGIALYNELANLKRFLKNPEIDNQFCKPLSQRNISIEKRVEGYYQKGLWLIAKNKEIVGCLALIPKNYATIELSTFVINQGYRSKTIINAFIRYAEDIVKNKFVAREVIMDSWEGNKIGDFLIRRYGFKIVGSFEDLIKRPKGIKTVTYKKYFENGN